MRITSVVATPNSADVSAWACDRRFLRSAPLTAAARDQVPFRRIRRSLPPAGITAQTRRTRRRPGVTGSGRWLPPVRGPFRADVEEPGRPRGGREPRHARDHSLASGEMSADEIRAVVPARHGGDRMGGVMRPAIEVVAIAARRNELNSGRPPSSTDTSFQGCSVLLRHPPYLAG